MRENADTLQCHVIQDAVDGTLNASWPLCELNVLTRIISIREIRDLTKSRSNMDKDSKPVDL